jgi:hypothetical protein
MITGISYYDELNTRIIVAYEGGYQHLYFAEFRNEEITEWLETHSITPWVDPLNYMDLMRGVRNNKLQVCDYTQLPDAPFTTEEKAAWAVYRQALRDFPDEHPITTKAEYDALVWPQEP